MTAAKAKISVISMISATPGIPTVRATSGGSMTLRTSTVNEVAMTSGAASPPASGKQRDICRSDDTAGARKKTLRDLRRALRRAAPPVLSGAERLMFAVLEEAIGSYARDVGRDTPTARRRVLEFERWVENRSRRTLFAFETICDALELDGRSVRRTLGTIRRPSRRRSHPGGPIHRTTPLGTAA